MKRFLATLAIALAASSASAAGTKSDSFDVKASVTSNCTISAADINFAVPYDPVVANATLGQDLIAQGDLSIACTVGTTPTVVLNDGTAGVREMSNGTSLLKYGLFTDAARATAWNSRVLPAFVDTQVTPFTVYAKVDGGQTTVTVGNYSDTVTATINF